MTLATASENTDAQQPDIQLTLSWSAFTDPSGCFCSFAPLADFISSGCRTTQRGVLLYCFSHCGIRAMNSFS